MVYVLESLPFSLLFLFYECFASIYVCASHVCLWSPVEGSGSPGTGVREGYELPVGAGKELQEHPGLSPRPSLQPQVYTFLGHLLGFSKKL